MFVALAGAVVLFSCKTGKNTATLTAYTFTVKVREKYCYAARLDANIIKDSEKEKVYANQSLYVVKKGGTDTLSFPTTINGEFTAKLAEGVYQIYFPEKFAYGPQGHTQKCKTWRQVPDTTVVLNPAQTSVRLNLYRPCSPCNPIRQ